MTSPIIAFGLYDLDIKPDSTPSASDLQSFSNINDLETGDIQPLPYATYEPDFWLLDGNFKFMPSDKTTVHLGMMSLSMSDALGNFATPPVLSITFGSAYSCSGLVLSFAQYTNDYANSIKVDAYDGSNNLISSFNCSPDTWQYQVDEEINNFQKLIITFYSTNNPYRYLRLTGIDFGRLVWFTGSDIKAASVVEEIDMLSATVPGNTCELELFSDDAEFSIVNPSGNFANLTQRQPLSIYEKVGSSTLFMGEYFLNDWKNTSDKAIEFDCIDWVGVMTHTTYRGGIWLDGSMMSQTLIYQMMEAASIPYDLDPDLYNIPIIGWIPLGNCRDALQQIAFCVGAFVDCSRNSVVRINKTIIAADEAGGTQITKADKGEDQSLELNTLVTGVEVTAHNYAEGTTSTTLFNGTLEIGIHEIDFSQPAHSLTITGATILSSGANYAIISVTTAGTVVLTGYGHSDSTQLIGIYSDDSNNTTTPNVLNITNATLVNSSNGQAIAQRIYDYYQQRYLQKVKLYAPFIKVGQLALVDTLFNGQVRGVVEKMEIDLFGGFVAQVDINGVVSA